MVGRQVGPRRQATARVDIRVLAAANPHPRLDLGGVLLPEAANYDGLLRLSRYPHDFPVLCEASPRSFSHTSLLTSLVPAPSNSAACRHFILVYPIL